MVLAFLWWLPEILLSRGEPRSGFPFGLPVSPVALQVFGLLLFLVSAFLINSTAARHRLTGRNSYLTAFFFILAGSATGQLTQWNGFLAAAFFFFLFYRKTFALQNNPQAISGAFDAGLFLGLASLFFSPILLLLPFVWMALIIYQTSQWRPYFTVIVGMALPWFFVFSGYFWFNKTDEFQHLFIKYFHFRGLENPFASLPDLFMFFLVALFTLTAALWLAGNFSGFNVNRRQHALVGLWGIVFTAFVLFFFRVPPQALILLAGPSALILGTFFSGIKNLKWANLSVVIWMVLTFLNQYHPFFHAS